MDARGWRMMNRRLEAEWRAKLKASGFADLEGSDRDGPLSDRGKPHVRGNLDSVTEADHGQEALHRRLADGAAYHGWAVSVLREHRFRSSLERRIWARHAEGYGLATTAQTLGITYHAARDAVIAVKARNNQSSQSKETVWRARKDRRARQYRPLTLETAAKLALVLVRSLMQTAS
jgi:hypothetical protein